VASLTAVPTDDDIKALRREFGGRFRNFTEEQWRDLAALLPPGSKEGGIFFHSFLDAANNYWRGMATTPTTEHSVRRLDKLLKDARADLKRERMLAPERAAALFEMAYFDMKWPGHNVEGARFHRESFLNYSVILWGLCGGKPTFSRDKDLGTPTGPLIRYLSLACNLVMGKEAPALETLATFIQRHRS
jgi:hypothetical protein